MIRQPRHTTPFLRSLDGSGEAAGRAAPRAVLDPDRIEMAEPAAYRRPLRRAGALREQYPGPQLLLRADEPVAIASVIAQEPITSRESGALRTTMLAAGALLALFGAVSLLKMIGLRLLG